VLTVRDRAIAWCVEGAHRGLNPLGVRVAELVEDRHGALPRVPG
jgi:hypothetical protein